MTKTLSALNNVEGKCMYLSGFGSRRNWKERAGKSEIGSIAPLMIGFFMILMSAVYLVSDLSAVYIDRRNLISTAEAALYQATQELDRTAYYMFGPKSSVPIDCAAAETSFREIVTVDIEVLDFSCDGQEVRADVKRDFELPFQLRTFAITRFTNRIQASAISEFSS